MIVKDESHIIEDTLEKLSKHITFDYWVICDTGSTDGTQDIIRNFFEKKRIRGELLQQEWRDFGHNRTLALEGAYMKADYIFIFDADDTIHGTFKVPAVLDKDLYKIKFGEGFTYYRPLLITARKKSKFIGVLHEFVQIVEQPVSEGSIEGDYFVDSGKTGARSRDKDKYLKDANILKAAYHKEVETGGGLTTRYAFYCAQSFKDCGKVDDSIEWYTLVADKLNSWVQERYYACLMIGNLYRGKGNTDKALEYYLKAEQFDSDRTEGVIFATEIFRDKNLHKLVVLMYKAYRNYNKNPLDKLFLYRDLYNDVFEFNCSVSAYIAGDHDLAYECSKAVILNNIAQHGIIDRTFKNMRFLARQMSEDNNTLDLFYRMNDYMQITDEPKETAVLWNILFKKNRTALTVPKKLRIPVNKNRVFLSITSCKRLDLFQETIYSILNHWTDVEEVDYWFCVDDNSSKDDRQKMKKMFPFLNFHMKTPQEKGHRESMNIIWNKLNVMKPKYWIHLEDDFLFHTKRSYVEDSIKFLESQRDIKQVLFNREYAETIEQVTMRACPPVSPGFVVHEYKQGQFSHPNCHYWPHYSFRPSMIDVKTILSLGNYDSPNTFFEMDYAHRWTNAGYRSAFFDTVCCRHTGRLTSERNNKDIKNAYDLNDEGQFSKRSMPIKIVNLKRRPDRKERTRKTLADAGMTDFEFIEAVDGKELKPTLELKKLFEGNDFGNRRSFFGFSLSHYNLWKQLLADDKNDYYVILEDDITLAPDFKKKFETLTPHLSKYEYLVLGYHMFTKNREATKDLYMNPVMEKIDIAPMRNDLYIGGFFAYSINKVGAKIMIDYVANNGIKQGLDWLIKVCKELPCKELRPHLIYSQWYETVGQNIDTDVQKDFDTIDFSGISDISDKFTFIKGYDQMNFDLYFHRKNVQECMEIALKDPHCAGFNTLGFFKSVVDTSKLSTSGYFGPTDGLYVKKERSPIFKKTKIKLLANWASGDDLIREFSTMPTGNLELVKGDDADYFVIISTPGAKDVYDPKRTIIFQMEPWVYDNSKPWGVKCWGDWANPDPEKFLHVRTHRRYLNNVQWSTVGDLVNLPEKKDAPCIILSPKLNDVGHHKRTEFVRGADVGKPIDVYGRENYHKLESYVGQVPSENRYNVYAKYKYVIAVENNFETNYASEKIWEPLVCECLPFYWGCPNLEEYIDPLCFVRLPLDDYAEAARIIKTAIEEDWWAQRIDIIRTVKKKIMSEMGMYPTIERIITGNRELYIGGCVRNCGPHLKDVFDNIRKITRLFSSYQVVIAYDYSTDNSILELQRLAQEIDIKFIHMNGNSSRRTENICNARNAILNYLKGREYKYHMMLDMDDICAQPFNVSVIKDVLARDDWDAVSFNRPDYYDAWALSIDHFRFSCWHYGNDSWILKVNPMQKYIMDKLKKADQNSLVECESAFCGFAIYRPEKFVGCEYSWEIKNTVPFMCPEDIVGTTLDNPEECEHRPFHLSATQKNGARIRICPRSLFDTNLESDCKFVSSRGILASCDIKSTTPISSIQTLVNYNFNDVKDGSVVYVCGSAMREFVKRMEKINAKITLVTGDCDWSLPDDVFLEDEAAFNAFIESDKIVHWFSQNCVKVHPKMSIIPIGMDYHTMKKSDHEWGPKATPNDQEHELISFSTVPFWEREVKCYSNFHFSINTRFADDRCGAMTKLRESLVFYEPKKLARRESWANQSKYAFVLSPHGNGLDCHRTWEALCIGCIPIVKTSAIDRLFEDLPVLIVQDWADVTQELLEKTVAQFKDTQFNYSKLTLAYWMNKIRGLESPSP